MSHDTRYSRKIRDDENKSSKERQISSKGSSTSGSAASDTSSLRRSSKESLLKKNITLSPSSIRKSERLEKKVPQTPPDNGKFDTFKKKMAPSPLRRSDRAKSHSSTSSGSKISDNSLGSSLVKRKKEKKGKSVDELTLATKEVSKSEKHNVGPGHAKNKIRTARAYKELFKNHRKRLKSQDHSKEQSRQNEDFHGDNNDYGGEVEGPTKGIERKEGELKEKFVGRDLDRSLVGSYSSLNKSRIENLENNIGVDLSCQSPMPCSMNEASDHGDDGGSNICAKPPLLSSSNATAEETSVAPERVHVDCTAMEKLRMPELKGSTLNGKIDDALESNQSVMPSKRKRNLVDGDSNTSETNATKAIPESVSPFPSGSTLDVSVETCSACFKRLRVENDRTKLEFCSCSRELDQDVCGAFVTELHADRDEAIADSNIRIPEKGNNCTEQKKFLVGLQTNGELNTCFICALGGKLLCCDGRGCNRSYHLSCLDAGVSLGVWYCSMCVRKKIEFGIHSVSKGIESIWDAREAEVSAINGLKKEFFVKYKGLAHIHNRWVPESEVLLEAPMLLDEFSKNNQVNRWKKEWTIPRRLLKCRSLLPRKQRDNYLKEHTGDKLFYRYEWLVKWHGLDYEGSTWELENAACFNSLEGQGLIRDYENRCERAKKRPESKKGSVVKLSQLPAGFDHTCLDNVNKLHELWHKGSNAIIVHDKERIKKVIAFILSFQSDVGRPFLIVSTPSTLSCWDDEFFRLAPSINVAVYTGNKDLRRSIRTVEFDEAGGSIMFEVLVTSLEAIIEDKDVFECVEWATVIIDECQDPSISKQLVQIKFLDTSMWLIMSTGILEENSAKYLGLLSLLETHNESQNGDHLTSYSGDNLGKLKERLSRYIVQGSKPDSSRFLEYWVPVQISTVQLEQYCENLLSNSTLILSVKKDLAGALYDVLLSARKCCDHPYIVHPSLQGLLTKDLQAVEYLDVGIKASGKLRLLDMMLKEIKSRGLRVLILFQSISGSGSAFSLGDILDDFVRQRYGENSYERIECSVLRSKKDAAMNMFNNKEHGRFVFLLEARACRPIIKLSSVDMVIIFGSDWNPQNDIRALQKISLDSQSEQINVFRLYSACTLEEKLLIRAKQGKILDIHAQNISSDILLWGSPYQFDKLDHFHGCTPASTTDILSEESLLKDVIQEFQSILPQDGNNNLCNLSIISKVNQTGGAYITEVQLLCETKSQHTGEAQPLSFWSKLLQRKHPQWKYCSGFSPRNRKRPQHLDELSQKLDVGNAEVVRKRKKVVNGSDGAPNLKPGSDWKSLPGCKDGFSVTAHNLPHSSPRSTACPNKIPSAAHKVDINVLEERNMFESEERRKLRDAQKSLHQLLRPEILKLCGILQVSDNVKAMVEKFLQYVMSNHHIPRDPVTILQAFQISLCWTVASFLKHKVDHKESLALAKQHLNFNCKKEEADYVYSMLRCLKRTFIYNTGSCTAAESQNLTREDSAQKDVSKSIKEIQKKIQKQMKKLVDKQSKEKSEEMRTYEEENRHLERELKTESVVIRSCFPNSTSTRTDKLKTLERKINENKTQMDLRLECIEAVQLEARIKLSETGKRWIEEVQSWACVELVNRLPSEMPEPWLEFTQSSECHRNKEGREGSPTIREHDVDKIVHISGGVIALPQTPENVPDPTVAYSGPETTSIGPCGANGVLDTTSRARAGSCTDFMEKSKRGSPSDVKDVESRVLETAKDVESGLLETVSLSSGLGNLVPVNGSSEKQIPGKATECATVSSSHGLNNDGSVSQLSSDEQINVVMATAADKEAELGVLGMVSSDDGQANSVSMSPCSSEETTEHETISSSKGSPNSVSMSPCSSHRAMPDKLVDLAVRQAVRLDDELGNNVSVHPTSSGEQVSDTATEKGNTEVHVMASDSATKVYEQNGADCAVSGSSHQKIPLVNSPEVHSVTALVPDGSVALDQAPQDEGTVVATTAAVQGNSEVGGKQNTCQPAENPVCQSVVTVGSGTSTHELPDNHPVVQQSLLLSSITPDHSTPELSSADRVEIQPRTGDCSFNQVAPTPLEFIENVPDLLNQTVLRPVPCSASGFGLPFSDTRAAPETSTFNSRLINAAIQGPSRTPLPLCPDPLQYELERLNKQTDLILKSHEDTKQQLNTDCDKEIEEAVAEIRRKYEMRFQEIEAEFLLKKMELDSIHNTVLMNKILAEAFRSKCMDLRASGAAGVQQDGSSSFTQQLVQLSMQDGQRLSPVSSSSMINLPTASLQTSVAPIPSPQTTSLAPSTILNSTGPPRQTLPPAPTILPTIPARPPHIGTFSSPGIYRGGSEIRAPAPHLQPFRPSTSMSSQQSHSNSPAASAALPHTPRSSAPTHQSVPYNSSPLPESGGELSALRSLSTMGLLMHMNSQPGVRASGSLPSLLNSVPDQNQLNCSQATAGFGSVNPVHTDGPTEIVCLSDED